jgi:hypothetical protein
MSAAPADFLTSTIERLRASTSAAMEEVQSSLAKIRETRDRWAEFWALHEPPREWDRWVREWVETRRRSAS